MPQGKRYTSAPFLAVCGSNAMPSYRICVVLLFIASAAAAFVDGRALGQAESASSLSAPPPQQMPAYGSPASYSPSPSTSYPSAQNSATPYPSTYPSTSTPNETSPTDSLLDEALAGKPASLYAQRANAQAAISLVPANSDRPFDPPLAVNEPEEWQLLPNGLLFKSFMASNREPRLASQIIHERNLGWLWDATVGGRAGLVRYGTENPVWPQGWQLDVEGAAFPRLDFEHDRDLNSVDFRGGVLSTTRNGPFESKFGYYHLSSHLGDEYMVRNQTFGRINYVRDCLVAGLAVYVNPSLRLYSEAGWAFNMDGGAKPWEFQFGVEWCSTEPTGACGAPFLAVNTHLRQENNFGGNFTLQTGWQWRGQTGRIVRTGMQYFNGMSDQYQFYNHFEEQIGFGLWYDF
jgi:hypothetical protein